MKPLIKYVGGKARIASSILSRFPDKMPSTYVEPFVGGGAIFAALHDAGKLDGVRVHLGDVNPDVIQMYMDVQDVDKCFALSQALLGMAKKYKANPEGYFNSVKDSWNKNIRSTARFIFLHQTTYSGLWRENKRGELNVAWGKYKSPSFPTSSLLAEWNEALQGVTLHCGHFVETIDTIRSSTPETIGFSNDHAPPPPGETFVPAHPCLFYFDPPYFDTFVSYTSEGFPHSHHVELLCQAHLLRKQEHEVFFSNKDTDGYQDLVELVAGACDKWPMHLASTVAKNGSQKAEEILFRMR